MNSMPGLGQIESCPHRSDQILQDTSDLRTPLLAALCKALCLQLLCQSPQLASNTCYNNSYAFGFCLCR